MTECHDRLKNARRVGIGLTLLALYLFAGTFLGI